MTIIRISDETTRTIESFDELANHIGEEITIENSTIGLTTKGTLHSFGGDARTAYVNWSENYRQSYSKQGLHGGLDGLTISVPVKPAKLPEDHDTLIYIHEHSDEELNFPKDTIFFRPQGDIIWSSIKDDNVAMYDWEIKAFEIIDIPAPSKE